VVGEIVPEEGKELRKGGSTMVGDEYAVNGGLVDCWGEGREEGSGGTLEGE